MKKPMSGLGAALQRGRGLAQRAAARRQARAGRLLGDEAADLLDELGEVLAAARAQLARDEIEGLDVVGALVDREDLGVAQVLLGRMVLDEPGAAVDLDGHLGDAGRPGRSRRPSPPA